MLKILIAALVALAPAFAQSATTQVSLSFSLPNAVYADCEAWARTQYNDPPNQITVTASVGPTDNAINVSSTMGLATSGTIIVDNEALTYTGTNGYLLTGVARSAMSSTAAQHAIGAMVHVARYPSDTLIFKALLTPGVLTAVESLGMSSTALGSFLATIMNANIAINGLTAMGALVQ